MRKLKAGVATLAVAALALTPAGIAAANNGGQHGNHCGYQHAKHVKGVHAGLKVGQSCIKA